MADSVSPIRGRNRKCKVITIKTPFLFNIKYPTGAIYDRWGVSVLHVLIYMFLHLYIPETIQRSEVIFRCLGTADLLYAAVLTQK